MRDRSTEWQITAQAYLARLGAAEYSAAIAAHVKAGRVPRTYRHNPSEYQCQLCALLGRNDEEGFKALKMLQGYASEIGV